MNSKQVTSLKKFIIYQQNHWVYFSIICFFYIAVPKTPINLWVQAFVWFTIGFFPYLFYTVTEGTDHPLWFWGVHVSTVLFAFLLPAPHQVCFFINVLSVALYCWRSLFFRYSKGEKEEKTIPLLVPFGINFVVMLLLQYLRLYEYQRVFVNLLILQIFLYCVAAYVENYAKFLSLNKHSIGYMPVKSIFFTGAGTITALTGTLCVILLVVANRGSMNDIVRPLLDKIAKMIRRLHFTIRNKKGTDVTIEEYMNSEGIVQGMPVLDGETSAIVEVLGLVVFCIIAVYVVSRIIKFLPYLFRLFRMPAKMQTEETEIEDIREKVEVLEKTNGRRLKAIFEILTPAQKIRRRYRKKILVSREIILSKGKKDIMEWYTARECSEFLENPDMGTIYEKARYSPYECTPEDVKRMKEACK